MSLYEWANKTNERTKEWAVRNARMNWEFSWTPLTMFNSKTLGLFPFKMGILSVWDANQWSPGDSGTLIFSKGGEYGLSALWEDCLHFPVQAGDCGGGVWQERWVWKDQPKTHKRPIGIVNRPGPQWGWVFLAWQRSSLFFRDLWIVRIWWMPFNLCSSAWRIKHHVYLSRLEEWLYI